MPYEPGNESVERELLKLQLWAKDADIDLNGRNGEEGVIREWRDFKSQLKVIILIFGAICATPGVLVALSALGVIHLR